MAEEFVKRYYQILNMGEDFIRCGFRKGHPDLNRAGFRGLKAMQKDQSPITPIETTWSRKNTHLPDASSRLEELEQLEELAIEIRSCTACRLCNGRIHAVPGEGVPSPRVMLIGEAPGAQEDKSGSPFVGPAGKYLDKWMKAVGLSREKDLFIGNIIKCRPPDNRDPFPDESAACRAFLDRQIDILKPQAILTLGRISMQLLLETGDGIGRRHGELSEYRNIPLIPTYHPSGVLRNPQYRVPVWEDLKGLKRIIGDQP
jgi:uracil-DNA glycosylase